MDLDRLLEIVNALSIDQREEWKRRLILSFADKDTDYEKIDFTKLIAVVYGTIKGVFDESKKVICYGVGRVAEKNIERLSGSFKIAEFWDQYSEKTVFYDTPVARPYPGEQNAIIVICVNKRSARNEVYFSLRNMGYTDLYFWDDFLWLNEIKEEISSIRVSITEESNKVINELVESFIIISNPAAPVLFSIIPKSLLDKQISPLENSTGLSVKIKERLQETLIISNDNISVVDGFIFDGYSNSVDFVKKTEELLRTIMAGTKTKERPIRLTGDFPYDSFAITGALWIIIDSLFGNDTYDMGNAIEIFKTITPSSMIINSIQCKYLCNRGEYTDALRLARKLVHIYPNELLSNETLYQVVKECIENGISVPDDIPRYDLNERFCWSGISFAWCGGFDIKNDRADFGPCFRPLQCAARPDGEFWTSDDWKEFRKSVTDGSFRYCQKTQCANIVAGWLPKKNDFKDTELWKLFNGDYDVIPELEELHFSYDGHCNLKCPSCRLEIQTNSKEKNEELDIYYEKYLKQYVRSAKHLCLSGCGEALLSPHSRRLLQSLSRKEYPYLEVELRTNMTVLNEKTWSSLGNGREVIKHIAASIDAAKKETFEKLRYPAKWDIVYDNLLFVKQLRDDNEIDVFEFHVVVQKTNIDELLDIVKLAINMHVDVVTFSKMINWRDMPQEEYDEGNPYWVDSSEHEHLMHAMDEVEQLRDSIEKGTCPLIDPGRKMYINIHFRPDPNDSYNEIRTGRYRIR